MEAKKKRLGVLLLQHRVITRKELNNALAKQKETGAELGQVLISMGFITQEILLNFLSEQLTIPIFDFRNYQIKPEVSKVLSEAYARRFRAIVLEKKEDHYVVGMVDPLDIVAIDELKRVIKRVLKIVLVSESDLLHTLDMVYRHTEEITSYAEALGSELGDEFQLENLLNEQGEVDAPVVKLLTTLFTDAMQVKASDIHIEPGENVLYIRLRVDGVLQEQVVKEKNVAPALALRLKLMAGLNISERRLPQDGRFNIKVKKRVIDVRLSTLPTQYGESVVMRLLDQVGAVTSIDNIGMDKEMTERFKKIVKQPHGIILVTGPTGSGKSTTLYNVLSDLNSSEKKIIAVEDPVEYRLPRINQVQVHEKIGLTFAKVLRTTLRQDPDIIMVGEMRDQETAEIGIRAALTGHLVLSTLHTNDSASTALRLVDMNIDGYLVAATLRGVLAQRLVRRICENCKKNSEITDAEKTWLTNMKLADLKGEKFSVGKGCSYCNQTGYKGRTGIFELLELDEDMMEALRRNDPIEFSKITTTAMKGKLLMDSALALAKQGVTTVSEAIRITGEN